MSEVVSLSPVQDCACPHNADYKCSICRFCLFGHVIQKQVKLVYVIQMQVKHRKCGCFAIKWLKFKIRDNKSVIDILNLKKHNTVSLSKSNRLVYRAVDYAKLTSQSLKRHTEEKQFCPWYLAFLYTYLQCFSGIFSSELMICSVSIAVCICWLQLHIQASPFTLVRVSSPKSLWLD